MSDMSLEEAKKEIIIPTLKRIIYRIEEDQKICVKNWERMGRKTWWNGYKCDPLDMAVGAKFAYSHILIELRALLEVWESL